MALAAFQRTALLIQVTYFYLLQGIPYGFQVKYLPLILRKEGHNLSAISFINLVSLPWILKFSWAHLFDRYAGNGKTWITGCLCMLSVTSAFLHYVTNSFWLLVPCLLLLSFLSASLDIAVDSLAIRKFEAKDLGYCNIGHIVGYKIGILFGGGALLTLHQEIGLKFFTLGLSVVYGLSAVMVIFYKPSLFHGVENKQENKGDRKTDCITDNWLVLRNLLSPGQMWLVIFVFMYKVGEQGFASMYPMLLIDKGLSLSHIGVITGIFGQICSMAGSTVGGILISKFGLSIKELLFRTTCLRFLILVIYSTFLTKMNIHFFSHVIIDCIFQLLAGTITTLTFTTMMQTSKMLPSSIHAVHFTLLASFEVLGKLMMKSFAGTMASNVGFSNFFLTCCCLDGLVVLLTFTKCKLECMQVKLDFIKKLE